MKPKQPRLVAPRIIVQNAKTGRLVAQRQGSRQSLSRAASVVRSSSSIGELSASASIWEGSRPPSGNATPLPGTHTKPGFSSMEYVFKPIEMLPRKDVLFMPAPVRAFEEAITYFETKNKQQKPAVRHSEEYPLHAAADRKAHRPARPSSAPSTVRWRHDPSSYQTRERGADKVRQHQLLNHEPPRGMSNRPSSPAPRSASSRPSSSEWLVNGFATNRSPRAEPAKIETLIFDSAERLAMLKAAKSSLTTGNSAVKTHYRPSQYSPYIHAPETSNIPPYKRVDAALPGACSARSSGGSHKQQESKGTDAAPLSTPLNSSVSYMCTAWPLLCHRHQRPGCF